MSDREGPESHGAEERIDLTGLGRLSDRPPPPKGENAIRIMRGLSVLLLAVAAAGLPWYFVTRGGGSDNPGSAPAARSTTSSPTASPTPTITTYEIFNVEDCLNIRSEPSTTSTRIDCLTKDVRVTSDGKTKDAGGRLWRHVYDPLKKMWGWAADEYLKPVG